MTQVGVWRCASKISGAQCVMTAGMTGMQKLLADNWASDMKVS
jgi:hypothetical protein